MKEKSGKTVEMHKIKIKQEFSAIPCPDMLQLLKKTGGNVGLTDLVLCEVSIAMLQVLPTELLSPPYIQTQGMSHGLTCLMKPLSFCHRLINMKTLPKHFGLIDKIYKVPIKYTVCTIINQVVFLRINFHYGSRTVLLVNPKC